MPRPNRDDYERYLTRHRSNAKRGSALSLEDFERLLRRLDDLYVLDLERELSDDERSRLDELSRVLDFDDSVRTDSSTPGASALESAIAAEIQALEDFEPDVMEGEFGDVDIDPFDEDFDDADQLAALDRQEPNRSRLGSPRPDARNRRSVWQRRRREARD